MRAWMVAAAVGWCGMAAVAAGEDMLSLSGALSPEVRLGVRLEGGAYRIRIEADNPYAKVSARLATDNGAAAVAPLERLPADTRVAVPEGGLFRLAVEVSWFNDDGSLRQREVFRAPAVGSRLPEDSRLWEAFDYAAYRERAEDLARRIRLPVRQPMDGRLSVVVEAQDGRRVRNLVSGQEAKAGVRQVEWDGRDEIGNMVAPGKYNYRTVSHPGITAEYHMQFGNGGEKFFVPFGTNHGTMTALASDGELVFAAAPLTEGGWAIVALAPDGSFVRGYPTVNGAGIEEVFLAVVGSRLYVFNDGHVWGGSRNTPKMTLTVYDIATGGIVPLKGSKSQFVTLRERAVREYEPGEKHVFALAGVAYSGGLFLYVSDRERECVMVLDGETDKTLGEIPLEKPGPLAMDGGRLVAVSGRRVVVLSPEDGKVTPLFEVPFVPRGMCVGAEGFYLTGDADSTVKLFSRDGKIVKSLGEPGGAYQGKWNPDRLVNPVGVTLAPDGALWVAEDRRNPKRLSKWDVAKGRCVYDKIGCPAYGSPGAGFDPQRPTRWIGQRCLWEVDQETGKERIVSVLQKEEGHLRGKIEECVNYTFVHQDGRTFVLGMFKGTLISELMPDGSLKDLALISCPHNLLYGLNWNYVPAFCDVVEKRFPKADRKREYTDESCRFLGTLWVDADGDGDFDADEFQFLPENTRLGNFGWGLKIEGLTMRLPYRNERREEFVMTLEPDGYNACGAPAYSFGKAAFAPLKEELPPGSQTLLETTLNDTRGNIVVNTDPFMFSVAPDGRVNWLYPNRWTNVHGSHKAPLPKVGELQGILFGLGTVPLDREGDVMAFVGNHGRVFLMTTDGLYLDEMFQDCRVAEVVGPGLIGGEAFGGSFGYDPKNKRYVLQVGTSGYRIYHLRGLDKVVRGAGTVEVTPEMLVAASRRNLADARAANAPKQAEVPRLAAGASADFGALPVAATWSGANGDIRVRGTYDANNLYLRFDVADNSPWVNNGKDWTLLFKTGDSVDVQLGTDAAAPAGRSGAAPGDVRLLIAPFNGKPLAVLYRYRLADKAGANPVEFASPWRSEKVDDVRRLENVKVDVQVMGGGYRVDAVVPLAELGLGGIAGKTLRGDFGVVYGDRQGTMNLARVYWSNQATGLVNDVPGETMLAPVLWGSILFKE